MKTEELENELLRLSRKLGNKTAKLDACRSQRDYYKSIVGESKVRRELASLKHDYELLGFEVKDLKSVVDSLSSERARLKEEVELLEDDCHNLYVENKELEFKIANLEVKLNYETSID